MRKKYYRCRETFRRGASFFAALSAMLIFLSACGVSLPDYFPMQSGNRWEYRIIHYDAKPSGKQAGVLTLSMAKLTDPITAVVEYSDGSPPELYSKHKGFISATGLESTGLLGPSTNYLLWLPPHEELKWEVETMNPETLDTHVQYEYKVERIGAMKVLGKPVEGCIVVSCENFSGTERELYYWAPGIGLAARELYSREGLEWKPVLSFDLAAYHLEPIPPRTAELQRAMIERGMAERLDFFMDVPLDTIENSKQTRRGGSGVTK